MRRCSISFCVVFLLITSVFAQKKNIKYSKTFGTYYYPGPLSITIGAGTAFYRGNICGKPECNTFKPSFNAGLNYKPSPHFSYGAEFNYLELGAYGFDPLHKYQFTSQVVELRGFLRFYLMDDKIRMASDKRKGPKKVKLYATVGLVTSYFKPLGQKRPVIQPDLVAQENVLQGATAGLFGGGGIQLSFSSRFAIIGEATYAGTMTDVIDSFKRQNPPFFADTYGLVGIKAQFSF